MWLNRHDAVSAACFVMVTLVSDIYGAVSIR